MVFVQKLWCLQLTKGGLLCLFQSSHFPQLRQLILCMQEKNRRLCYPVCGWVGDASTSIPRLCWDSTAAGLLSAELSLSSQWNISSWPKPALALWTSALVTRAFADNNTMHCNCIIRIVKNPGTHNAFTSYKYFQKNLWLKAQIILQCSLVYSITLFLLQDDLYITLNFKFSRTVKIFV